MEELRTRATLLCKIRDSENESAWREFVEVYTPLVYRFVRGRGLQHADASDVVQDSMKAVASGIQNFEYRPGKASFRAWLYTVARSKLNTHFRRTLKHPAGTGRTTVQRRIEDEPDPSEVADWDLDYRRHMFNWAAAKVREEFGDKVWAAFWKTAVEDEAPQDVARELEVNPGSVYVAKNRVIKRMRDAVQAVAGELDVPALT